MSYNQFGGELLQDRQNSGTLTAVIINFPDSNTLTRWEEKKALLAPRRGEFALKKKSVQKGLRSALFRSTLELKS